MFEILTSSQRKSRDDYNAQQEAGDAADRRAAAAASERFKAANERNSREAVLAREFEEAKIREADLLHEASGPQVRLKQYRTQIAECYNRAALDESQRKLQACPICQARCDDDATLAHVSDLLKQCDREEKELRRLVKLLDKAGEETTAALERFKAFQSKNPPGH